MMYKTGDKEHYYYVLYTSGKWHIIKANNQKQVRAAGYDIKKIVYRARHYDEARVHLEETRRPTRVHYTSLTGIDYID